MATPARTLVDLSAVSPTGTVEKAVDAALRDRLVIVAGLRACFDALTGPGRRRVAHFRPILDAREPRYSPGDSDLEARVERWLVGGGLPPPVAQFPVHVGGHRYRIDLAYPDLRIAIELDGWAATAPGEPSTTTASAATTSSWPGGRSSGSPRRRSEPTSCGPCRRRGRWHPAELCSPRCRNDTRSHKARKGGGMLSG